MTRKSTTVLALANEAEIDVHEVLLVLWDLGLDHILEPRDAVPFGHLKNVQARIGVASKRQLQTISYWATILNISTEDLRHRLTMAGCPLRPAAKRLPPGAIKHLKALGLSMGINPMTGRPTERAVPAPPPPVSEDPSPPAPRISSTPPSATPRATLVDSPSSVHRKSTAPQSKERPPSPVFFKLGRENKDMRWLDDGHVTTIHERLVEDFAKRSDPISPSGVRNADLLASALFRPQTGMGDTRKYPTVETAAGALLHALIHDHPFHNGNKRTAIVSTLVFLDWNGLVLTCTEEELFRFVIRVARHRIIASVTSEMADHEAYAIAKWIRENSRIVDKGENVLPFRKFRRILQAYGCEIGSPGKNGQVRIERGPVRKRRGIRLRRQPFTAQIPYRNEGQEIQIHTIKKVREDLRLTHEHGIDSSDFYAKGANQIDDFIAEYRIILDKLAKL
ncbi:type II toxin-antitoxin system death-on-curing family toxin [Candidatus Palauibacter sp.]|uniref:type II toxin-antitoxin system death-on-curing family toxin n=1 Tax=Candidatus Palauibacter sp. TaxID=3101350 RepID=UPI003B029882